MKIYIINFKDETVIRVRESEGIALKKALIGGAWWVEISGKVYNTSLMASVIEDEVPDSLINDVIPR